MNSEEYKRLKDTVPNFENLYCKWIDPDLLEYDQNRSQVRSKGHRVDMYPHYAELIKKGIPLPPISVIPLPSGRFSVMEGNTRAGGAKLAEKSVLISTYHHTIKNYTPDEWEDFQAKSNDHPLSSPNTVEDIERLISKQVKSGRLDRELGFGYVGKEEKYIGFAAQHYKSKIYKNSGHGIGWFRTRLKKALKGTTLKYFENYSKKEAFAKVKLHTGFAGKNNGDVCSNHVFWTFDRKSHLNPNVIGAAYELRRKNPASNFRISLVYHVGDLVGFNAADILKQREEIEDMVNQINTYHKQISKGNNKMFNHLYFLPQIKNTGGKFVDRNKNVVDIKKENLNSIIKSKVI